MQMLGRVLKVLKITGIVAGSVLLLLFILSIVYAGEIKKLMLAEVNKSLATPLLIEEVDFSLIRHFPYASVELRNVLIHDAVKPETKDTLLQAKKISLLVNLSQVFSKDIELNRINIYDGRVSIKVFENGGDNYHFWKSDTSSKSKSSVNLEHVLLNNVEVSYRDKKSMQHYNILSRDLVMNGKVKNGIFTMKTDGNLLVHQLLIKDIDYIHNKKIRLATEINFSNNGKSINIESGQLEIESLLANVKGEIKLSQSSDFYHLNIETDNADLKELLSVLPEKYLKPLSEYEAKGNSAVKLEIKGRYDADNSPAINADFKIEKGSLKLSGSSTSLDDIELKGSCIAGNHQPGLIDISKMNASLEGNVIDASLQIKNFEEPSLNVSLQTSLDLENVKDFVASDTLEKLTGTLSADISFAGKIKDIQQAVASGTNNVQSSGLLTFKNVNMHFKKNTLDFKNFNASLALQNNDVQVKQLSGNVSNTDLNLTGTLKNFINYILMENQELIVNASLKTNNLNLDELLTDHTGSDEGEGYVMKFNPRIQANIEAEVGNLNFRRFKASRIKGTLQLNNEILSGSNISFAAMQGNMIMDARIDASAHNVISIACKANVQKVDIKDMFFQLENFYQSTLTDENLKGKLTANITMTSLWSPALLIKSESVTASADVVVENGELNNFIPLQALSKYIKVSDLKNIRFSNIKNNITISNKKVIIPQMEIQNSAINISVSGTHDFDNLVDYKIKLLLSDVLGKKAKQNVTEFGVIEDDGLGRSMLFLSMKGKIDDPKFSYDKKSVALKIKDDVKKDAQNIKQMLKEDFGLFKKDTTTQIRAKKKEELQLEDE